eukprot:2185142-Prymnesium_polylepis.1
MCGARAPHIRVCHLGRSSTKQHARSGSDAHGHFDPTGHCNPPPGSAAQPQPPPPAPRPQ